VVKKKSRASASRAKGAKKGAKKPTVRRRKTTTRGAGTTAQELREGLDVKKLRLDLKKAIDTLQRRIEQGDKAERLEETRTLFLEWVNGIERTVCVDISGPCGEDMFFGS
jgi:hypothetical protein